MTTVHVARSEAPPVLAQRDLRTSALWRAVEAFYANSHNGLFGRFTAMEDAQLSPDGSGLVLTGSGLDSLQSGPWKRVFMRMEEDTLEPVSREGHKASRPKWSPDGQRLAFLESDLGGDQPQQLVFLHLPDRVRTMARVGGELGIEDYAWDPAGRQVIVWTREAATVLPTVPRVANAGWIPVARSSQAPIRQQLSVVLPDGDVTVLSSAPVWVWEAAWTGQDAIAVIASELREPANWYDAELGVLALDGAYESRYRPSRQIGRLTVNPSGQLLAVVEGTASDRGMVAGRLVVIDADRGEQRAPSLATTDVTYAAWSGETELTYLGLKRQRTVLGRLDVARGDVTETWSSTGSCGMPMPVGQAIAAGSALIAYEDWHTPPQLRAVGARLPVEPRLGVNCAGPGSAWQADHKGTISEVAWISEDGTELEGLLITPAEHGTPPYPLVINIHGGPVWAWRNTWGIVNHTPVTLLVSRGFAVFNPNARGSVGWGADLADAILGQMGGADLGDYTSGALHLVEQGVADAERLSVIGHSYGGLTTCNLVTHTTMFSAAVAISPVTDWLSQHHLSGIPAFDEMFVGDIGRGRGPHGPVTAAEQVRTPTLLIGCENDDCTPANQAIEFYRALARAGQVPAALALYPSEGHGIERWPALMDQSVRIVEWLERYAS